jgi:hypothetical protein
MGVSQIISILNVNAISVMQAKQIKQDALYGTHKAHFPSAQTSGLTNILLLVEGNIKQINKK